MPLTKAQIAELRALRLKKHRESSGRFVVEGVKVVSELLASGQSFAQVYVTAQAPAALTGDDGLEISEAEMAKISHYPTPSPVLAVGSIARAKLHPDELGTGFTLALDDIQDPGNVGTLLRIADWFGFDRVLISPHCADLFSQKVINASMGSFARVRVYTTNLATALGQANVPVWGCDLDGEPLRNLPVPAATVVVIGSEGRGLSADVAATLSQRVTIPRHGQAESLNAAVAAGIVCAHLRP